MNEILVLKRMDYDSDDGMFGCFTGVIECQDFTECSATFGEQRRADRFVHSFLRKVNKSVTEYESIEEVIKEFLTFCRETNDEGEEYDWYENEEMEKK